MPAIQTRAAAAAAAAAAATALAEVDENGNGGCVEENQQQSNAADSNLNWALIHLLDVARLRRELEKRGLDTKGGQRELAERLQSAVCVEKGSPPGLPSSEERRGSKRRQSKQAHEVTFGGRGEFSGGRNRNDGQLNVASPPMPPIVWAKHAPKEVLTPVLNVKQTPTKKARGRVRNPPSQSQGAQKELTAVDAVHSLLKVDDGSESNSDKDDLMKTSSHSRNNSCVANDFETEMDCSPQTSSATENKLPIEKKDGRKNDLLKVLMEEKGRTTVSANATTLQNNSPGKIDLYDAVRDVSTPQNDSPEKRNLYDAVREVSTPQNDSPEKGNFHDAGREVLTPQNDSPGKRNFYDAVREVLPEPKIRLSSLMCELNDDEEEEDEQLKLEKESTEDIDDLLKNPKELLQRASDILKHLSSDVTQTERNNLLSQIEQVQVDNKDYIADEEEEVEKPLPDFYGDPIPDDDEDDDALFEIAAGLRPKNMKKSPEDDVVEEEPLADEERVELDYFNADLNIKSAQNNKWLIEPDNGDGFALMWGGVRSNYGIIVPPAFAMNNSDLQMELDSDEQHKSISAIAFQIRIAELMSLKHMPFEEQDPHQVRLGWSRKDTSNMLGEAPLSFAYSSLGQRALDRVFIDYGETFTTDDVITSVLDLAKKEIRFYKNGQSMGSAFTDLNFVSNDVFFPHVATKNCKVIVNFGAESPEEGIDITLQDSAWKLPSEESAKTTRMVGQLKREPTANFWGQQSSLRLEPSLRPPQDKASCTIIVMVGLPGVGKTTWVRQYLKDHSDEHWVLLNTDSIMCAMTVNGVPRSRVHRGRWDMVMGLTAKAVNRSLQMACRRRHNYILDQTNVSRDARKRKLTQFKDFQRKCVVIIPSREEHERRLIKQTRQEGHVQMPAEAMLEMKGIFSIPCTEAEPIEDVIFVEPPISRVNEAIELVNEYNEEGKPWIRDWNRRTDRPQPLISDHRSEPPQYLGKTRISI